MSDVFADRLAGEVRARRAALRLTQYDLAHLAGVSERFVRFVEQGKRSVQLDSLLALLETLGLELQLTTRARPAARAIDGPRAADRPRAIDGARAHNGPRTAEDGPAPTKPAPEGRS